MSYYDVSHCLAGNKFALGEDGGLLIDEKMRTTEKNIFAAGDVCSPGWQVAPHWFQVRTSVVDILVYIQEA